MQPIVSCGIIIPTKNKAPRLKLTLSALVSQRNDIAEIIIVDDGSTDVTPSVVAQYSLLLPLKYIHPANKGRAAARNAGAVEAQSELLIFLDDDILVGKGFVQAHKQAHVDQTLVHGPLREMVGAATLQDPAAGGRGVPPLEYAILQEQGYDLRQGRHMINALERIIEQMNSGALQNIAPWLCAVGANMSIPRLAWSSLGGFDEGFGTKWGCEDLEFGYRAHKSGFEFILSKDAWGVHLTHQRADRWEQHQINLDRFVRKHPVPEVLCLGKLLGPDGSPEHYASAVLNHIR